MFEDSMDMTGEAQDMPPLGFLHSGAQFLALCHLLVLQTLGKLLSIHL